MKCQKNLAGYTILEVLIFLTISGALLISAGTLINGRQQQTQFSTGVRDLESRMQDLINDVENGFSSNNGSISCTVPGMSSNPAAVPVVTATPRPQGTNEECVFLGKAVQFYRNPSGYVSNIRAVSIAGKRLDFNPTTGKTEQPASIEESVPRAFYSPSGTTGIEELSIRNGIEVSRVLYVTNFSPYSTVNSFPEISIVQSVALQTTNNTATNLANGRASLAALSGNVGLNGGIGDLTASVDTLSTANIVGPANTYRSLVICMRDAPGGRSAAIGLGVRLDPGGGPTSFVAAGTDQNLSTQTFFDDQAIALGCAA